MNTYLPTVFAARICQLVLCKGIAERGQTVVPDRDESSRGHGASRGDQCDHDLPGCCVIAGGPQSIVNQL